MIVTNFFKTDLRKFKKAIQTYVKITGDYRLTLSSNAFDITGKPLKDIYSLHDNGTGNLDVFWSIFDNIEIENKYSIKDVRELCMKAYKSGTESVRKKSFKLINWLKWEKENLKYE